MSLLKQQSTSSSSHSILQSKTLCSFPHRTRIFSLKSVKKPMVKAEAGESSIVFARLQKALQNDNRKASRLISQPEATIPGFQQLRIQHKLWKYFQMRMQSVKTKVQKQRVNFCEREFSEIRRLIFRRRQAHRVHLQGTNKRIKDKYKQIHQLFEEIKQQKIVKFMNTVKKNNIKALQIDNSDKLVLIKQNIENIRSELYALEDQQKSEFSQSEKIKKEWKSLLINIIKHGYFMSDGIATILKEMIKIDYVPNKEDFPEFIDAITYQCFLKKYNDLKRQQLSEKEEKQKEKERTKLRNVSASIKNLRQIAKQSQLNKIYQGTREYMVDWLRSQSWKESCLLPKVCQKQKLLVDDWQGQERRRMKIVYEEDALRILKNMLFGPKVQILTN